MSVYPKNNDVRRGFTLLELLVVIAIISMLMGLILAGVGAVKEGARRARARLEAQSILEAVKTYKTDFGQWPGQTMNNSSEDAAHYLDGNLRTIYMALTNNARKRVYLEIQNDSACRKGVVFDPWNRPYAIVMDHTGDGECRDVSLSSLVPSTTMTTNFEVEAGVFSWGKKPEQTRKWVYTWPDQE